MFPPDPVALSIVIPAYNEARRLPQNLARIAECCASLRLTGTAPDGSWEVLIVVEQSLDNSLEAIQAAAAGLPAFRVIDNGPRHGKGYAVRQGMLQARGEIALFMDADLSTPLAEVQKFLDYFAAHPEADVVIGNRRHPSSRIGRPQGFVRRRLGALFAELVRRRMGSSEWLDTQCGFKAFRREAARQIFTRQRLDSFSFDVEILFLAAALDLRVVDLPVEWFDVRASKLHLLHDGWTMWRDLNRVPALVARTLQEQPIGGGSSES